MLSEFKKWGFDLNNIKWINHPNANELSDEFIDQLITKESSYISCGIVFDIERLRQGRGKGIVSCTYKHYLALLDIVNNDYDYGVIIEDNIKFKANIPEMVDMYIHQLDTVYAGQWDILFDSSWSNYQESPIIPGLFVYPKSNEITYQCHGGSKTATFYLVKKEAAKKMVEHYLPFSNAPDWWMNDLFRKLSIRSFWVEPNNVYVQEDHVSSCLG
jgi:GR25 family glycosyltransferase involved in LPS biosynthesis